MPVSPSSAGSASNDTHAHPAANAPTQWQGSAAHYSCDRSGLVTAAGVAPTTGARGRFGTAVSFAESTTKVSVSLHSPDKNEVTGPTPWAPMIAADDAWQQASPSNASDKDAATTTASQETAHHSNGSSWLVAVAARPPPPPPPPMHIADADRLTAAEAGATPTVAAAARYVDDGDCSRDTHTGLPKDRAVHGKLATVYGTATDWLAGASDDDMSSTEARGYGCGEGVSRTSSSASLHSPVHLGAVPSVALAASTSLHGIGQAPGASSSPAHPRNHAPAGRSMLSLSGSSGMSAHGVHTATVLSDKSVPRAASSPGAVEAPSQTAFVRAGMEALRNFTEQLRASQAADWGTVDDPTGVRVTCGHCFRPSQASLLTNESNEDGNKHTAAPSPCTDGLGHDGDRERDAKEEEEIQRVSVGFSLERFSPFYKLAVKELILECERRVANAPAAVRDRQIAHFRCPVSAAAAASSVAGPRSPIHPSACGVSCISTRAFDTRRPSASMDVLSTPVHGPAAFPSGATPTEAAPTTVSQCCLQVPTLAVDGPASLGKRTAVAPAHFPTTEDAALAGFFVAMPTVGAASASTGLSVDSFHAVAACGGVCSSRAASALGRVAVPVTDDLSLEALLKALDYYIPYKRAAPMVFIGGLAYLSRIAARCVSDYTSITHANWYRLVVVAVLTASKMYNEQTSRKLNRYFSTASGIPLAEMKRLEVDFLYLLDFDLLLEDSDVEEWLVWMEAVALRHGLFASLNHLVFGDPETGTTEAGPTDSVSREDSSSQGAASGPHRTTEPAALDRRCLDQLSQGRHTHGAVPLPGRHAREPSTGGGAGGGSGDCGSLLDSSIASPVRASEQRRQRTECGSGTAHLPGGLPSPAVFPTFAPGHTQRPPACLGRDLVSDDTVKPEEDPLMMSRLFSAAHLPDGPPTPPTLRELSRLADTPTLERGRTKPGHSGPGSPPSPSLFFSRGSRGTSTTAAGSSCYRPPHSTSTLPRQATATWAPPSSSHATGDAAAADAEANIATQLPRQLPGGAHGPTAPHESFIEAAAAGKGGRWGMVGRVKDVLGATASLVRGQLQVLSSPGTNSAPPNTAPRNAPNVAASPGDGGQRTHPRFAAASDTVAAERAVPSRAGPTSLAATATAQESVPEEEDGYYDDQGCFHLYDDEGFYDDEGYYCFYEDVGYYDDDGNYHYYEDEGYYDEEGNYHYYDDDDDDLGAEEDEEDGAEAYFQRCRPPAHLSPPSL